MCLDQLFAWTLGPSYSWHQVGVTGRDGPLPFRRSAPVPAVGFELGGGMWSGTGCLTEAGSGDSEGRRCVPSAESGELSGLNKPGHDPGPLWTQFGRQGSDPGGGR